MWPVSAALPTKSHCFHCCVTTWFVPMTLKRFFFWWKHLKTSEKMSNCEFGICDWITVCSLCVFTVFLTWVNCSSVRWGTRIQDIFTVGKLLALVLIIVVGMIQIAKGESSTLNTYFLASRCFKWNMLLYLKKWFVLSNIKIDAVCKYQSILNYINVRWH